MREVERFRAVIFNLTEIFYRFCHTLYDFMYYTIKRSFFNQITNREILNYEF